MTYFRYALIGLWMGTLGCAHAPVIQQKPELKKLSRALLGAGDVIDVRIFEEKELSGPHQISSEGTIRLPLIGTLLVSGLAPEEASDLIASEYKKKYLKNPEVAVFVQQSNSRKIYLLGEVKTPGPYPYEDNMTLIGAIAKAGGPTPLAAANRTIISRSDNGRPVKMTAKMSDIGAGEAPDLPVMPGDIIFVPQSLF
ncbi:MAG: polysaccharide biosynthesis/export family protein [Myxococcota bacterium]